MKGYSYEHNTYQDVWVHGLQIKGRRECEYRYQCIKNYFRKFKGQVLKILDFGANNGYFSFRLAEDFPEFELYLVEYNPLVKQLIELNQLENVQLIYGYFDEEGFIELIKNNDFDFHLMLSVLHHFDNPNKIIDYLTKRNRDTIFEIGYPTDEATDKIKLIWKNIQGKNAIQLNKWIGHDRPIYYTDKNVITLKGSVHNGCKSAFHTIGYEIRYGLFENLYKLFYPGTLNVKLDYDVEFKNTTIINTYYRVVPIMLNGILMYNLLTEEKGNCTDELEIISEYKLRKMFNYTNNKKIEIAINKKFIKNIGSGRMEKDGKEVLA
jgi:hypothetical protein